MRNLVALCILVLLFGCTKPTKTLQPGYYRMVLEVQDNRALPVTMRFLSAYEAEIYNAKEVIRVNEIRYQSDSIYLNAPVFEGYIAAKLTNRGFQGEFRIESYDRSMPVTASPGKERFKTGRSYTEKLDGVWEMTFSPNGPHPTHISKGIFVQDGNKITGTIQTNTGDYRYLEGVINGGMFQMSTFDGAHAFLFTGTIKGDKLEGIFYSGKHWKEAFIGVRNPNFELKDPTKMTFLKAGYKRLDFSFPDENGRMISLRDKQFENQVTVVQLMGSWCPNCLDESRFLSQYAKDNPTVKIVALAFEISKTKELAFQRLGRLRDKIGIGYPIALAQYGSDSKLLANEKLPMIEQLMAFPTTLFIDKKGQVRKIHTGFNGPATGKPYQDFVREFDSFVKQLQRE